MKEPDPEDQPMIPKITGKEETLPQTVCTRLERAEVHWKLRFTATGKVTASDSSERQQASERGSRELRFTATDEVAASDSEPLNEARES